MGYTVGEGPKSNSTSTTLNAPTFRPITRPAICRIRSTSIEGAVAHAYHGDSDARAGKAQGQLPIKVICPGKVYRRDNDDATHSHQFMQAEGLVVGENITLTDLKGTLQFMADRMFGEGRQIRFRPSYFQFTEPSVEVDVSCHICGGKGCPVCKGTGWISTSAPGWCIRNVLEMADLTSTKCSGFAFGVGIRACRNAEIRR